MSKKDADSTARIRQYLEHQNRPVEHQNRPYSVNDIFMNLHKDIGKTAVQKCLDQLVADGCVKEKVYGKQKVYVFDQSQFPPLDETQLKEMDRKITDLNETIKQKERICGETEARLRSLNSSLTTEEAVKKLQDLEEEVSRLQKKLADLQENQVLISKEEKDQINSENEKMVKMWRKRRRMAMDILDAILEGYPKKKKDLFDDIGIETDEDVGVKLPKA
ncbi:homologous-pairing protein 2 homolog [Penaeus monodon]|uniref:homologous-pairing protein 2 homolog n=1 Tax=Penaeus monodon TaxID=6687 RepID=UPI0018A77FAC|nr:homologous-pairing protein 2 homolog [Penaeus monodon]